METYIYIAVMSALTFAIFAPFGLLRLLSWIFKGFLYIIGFPYFLWKRRKTKTAALRKQHNYETLGHHLVLLGNSPATLKYLKRLIESGISEEDFNLFLQVNLENLKDFEIHKEKQIIRARLEEQADFAKMAAEQQELLIQSKLSMEQIRFREQLLEGLYQKIQKKYRL